MTASSPLGSKRWRSRAGSVSPRACRRTAGRLDLAFEDLGEQASRTLPAQCACTALRRLPRPVSPTAPCSPRCRCLDKPSIAVLPFANMSGDPEQEYFADGMVEEIITALSPHPLAVRHRPQFDLHLQGPGRRREAGRARARRALCPRRLGAQGGQRVRITGAADRCPDRHASVGRPLRRLARKTCSSCRTKSRSASPVSSSRHCRRPRCAAPPRGRRPTSAPTISTCARLRPSIQ